MQRPNMFDPNRGMTIEIAGLAGYVKGEPGPAGKPGEPGQPGEPGKTPEKGVDYWTEEDKGEILAEVNDEIDRIIEEKGFVTEDEVNEIVQEKVQQRLAAYATQVELAKAVVNIADTLKLAIFAKLRDGVDHLYSDFDSRDFFYISKNESSTTSSTPAFKMDGTPSVNVLGYPVALQGYSFKVDADTLEWLRNVDRIMIVNSIANITIYENPAGYVENSDGTFTVYYQGQAGPASGSVKPEGITSANALSIGWTTPSKLFGSGAIVWPINAIDPIWGTYCDYHVGVPTFSRLDEFYNIYIKSNSTKIVNDMVLPNSMTEEQVVQLIEDNIPSDVVTVPYLKTYLDDDFDPNEPDPSKAWPFTWDLEGFVKYGKTAYMDAKQVGRIHEHLLTLDGDLLLVKDNCVYRLSNYSLKGWDPYKVILSVDSYIEYVGYTSLDDGAYQSMVDADHERDPYTRVSDVEEMMGGVGGMTVEDRAFVLNQIKKLDPNGRISPSNVYFDNLDWKYSDYKDTDYFTDVFIADIPGSYYAPEYLINGDENPGVGTYGYELDINEDLFEAIVESYDQSITSWRGVSGGGFCLENPFGYTPLENGNIKVLFQGRSQSYNLPGIFDRENNTMRDMTEEEALSCGAVGDNKVFITNIKNSSIMWMAAGYTYVDTGLIMDFYGMLNDNKDNIVSNFVKPNIPDVDAKVNKILADVSGGVTPFYNNNGYNQSPCMEPQNYPNEQMVKIDGVKLEDDFYGDDKEMAFECYGYAYFRHVNVIWSEEWQQTQIWTTDNTTREPYTNQIEGQAADWNYGWLAIVGPVTVGDPYIRKSEVEEMIASALGQIEEGSY